MAEGSEDIIVAAKLTLARDSWSNELQSAKTDLERFKQDAAQMELRVRAVIDDQITPALARIRAEAAANPIRIPVILDGGGMAGGGGGDWRQGFAQIRSGFEGVGSGSGAVAADYPRYLARTATRANGGGVEPYEVNEFSGGGEFMLKPLDAPAEAVAYSPGPSTPNNPAILAAQSSMTFARGMGMMGRFMAMGFAHSAISRVEEQRIAWNNYLSNQGTTAQSQAALLQALDKDSSGIFGAVLQPAYSLYGYDPTQLAADINSQSGTERRMSMALGSQERTLLLGMSARVADAAGDPTTQRGLRAEEKYQTALIANREASRKRMDELNPAGAERAIAQEQSDLLWGYGHAYRGIAHLFGGSSWVDRQSEAKLRQVRLQLLGSAEESRAGVAAAESERTADLTVEQNRQLVGDRRADVANFDITGRARSGLMGVSGASAKEKLDFDTQQFNERIQLERQLAAAIADTNEKRREGNRIDAEQAAGEADHLKQYIRILDDDSHLKREGANFDYALSGQQNVSGLRALGMGPQAHMAQFETSLYSQVRSLYAKSHDLERTYPEQSAEFRRQAQQLEQAIPQFIADERTVVGRSETVRKGGIENSIHELSIASSHAAAQQRIRDEAAMMSLAHPEDGDLYQRLAKVQLAREGFGNAIGELHLAGSARSQEQRNMGQNLSAAMTDIQTEMTAALANADGDPQAQARIRRLAQARAAAVLGGAAPHAVQTTIRDIYSSAQAAVLEDPRGDRVKDLERARNQAAQLGVKVYGKDGRPLDRPVGGAGAGSGDDLGQAAKDLKDAAAVLKNAPHVYIIDQ